MSFWKNLFGSSKDKNLPMEEPEHEVMQAPPDDLMVREQDKQTDQSNNIEAKESITNKDSP